MTAMEGVRSAEEAASRNLQYSNYRKISRHFETHNVCGIFNCILYIYNIANGMTPLKIDTYSITVLYELLSESQ